MASTGYWRELEASVPAPIARNDATNVSAHRAA
jgi:hypothetical protein